MRKAVQMAEKLKIQSVSLYSNDLNPFGDPKLTEPFVWRRKIERDVARGVPLVEFSLKAVKRRQGENMAEIERERARVEFKDPEKKEDRMKLHFNGSDDLDGEINEQHMIVKIDKYQLRKPKYSILVHTGYVWSKYNCTHYDHDNPPPKVVQGYKFDIFYPDLLDKEKAPTYTIEKDGNSSETCIICFHAGPPYEDIGFRILNKEWDYSRKQGFKCTFEEPNKTE
ncbi:Cactin, C-terminal [Parasponia andersonii]|uniref:Cactin, C-terminal n=1 Tax=Parasponia andersonii TaxID=3476 RepID=A0A2P5BI31_PARAD|nr:Cactin, C-terminal [Parasponia andersonii]